MNSGNEEETAYIKHLLKKPVVIVGMMGAGKSRAGRKLADILALDFFDTDTLIEERAGQKIPEIFEAYGEQKFRETEKKVLSELLDGGPSVIASGGGAVMNPGAMEEIRNKAVSVWLKADIETLLARVKKNDNRPLLKNDSPSSVLEKLLAQREPVYKQADITIETDMDSLHKTMDEILKALSGFLKQSTV